MKVSVIIPTYNRAHTLKRAINSILSQTINDFEIIVVDDCSTDETNQLVHSFENVKYIVNRHKRGPAGARNQGIEVASGDYVAFLDSDDEWFQRHLENSIHYLESCSLDASYALWYRMKGSLWEKYSEEWLDFLIKDLNLKVNGKAILLGNKIAEYMLAKPFWCFHIDTLIVKRNTIFECGLFKEHFSSAEDLEFAFRLLLIAPTCLIREYHAYYYEGDDNIVALRKNDSVKMKAHNINMMTAFKEMSALMETLPFIVDKAKCREQLNQSIKQYEVLC
jgi:glycosyltransferase involved in cell wall biosynthesis